MIPPMPAIDDSIHLVRHDGRGTPRDQHADPRLEGIHLSVTCPRAFGDEDVDRGFPEEPLVELPQDSFGTMSIRANSLGEFTIGLARAGWWGICALEIGPDTEHEGKPLSQDAVLWVQVKDMQ